MTAPLAQAPLAQALFAPRAVALIGASADESKYSSLPQRFLRRHGFTGRIVPVNPKRAEVLGERAYPSLREAGGGIDHAFIMVPSSLVPGAIEDCAAAGVPVATVFADGFAERGEAGRALQERIVGTARGGGVRILGPNSLGVVSLRDGVALSTNEVLQIPELPKGRLGLISQSGSLLGSLLSRGAAKGIGFSRMISVGNEADLSVGEIGELLVDDPDTDAIVLFLEAMRQPDRFARMARRAFDAGKPVVAFKLGRHGVGEKLAATHTGAMAGSAAAMEAFLRKHGVLLVDQFETLLDLPALVIGRRPPQERRVAVMSTTGGGGALVVDSLAARGITPVEPDDGVVAGLVDQGITIGRSVLTDLTLTGTNAVTYGRVLDAFLGWPGADAVVAVVGSSAEFRPDRAIRPICERGRSDKPLAVFVTAQADASFRQLASAGIAAFRSPDACADALRAYLSWRPPQLDAEPPDVEAARRALTGAAGTMPAEQAQAVFATLGLPPPRSLVLPYRAPDDVPERVAIGLPFPVVAKIVSMDVPHKTEAGGVLLGIRSPEELAASCRRILASVAAARPDARIDGIQVQAQETGLAEVLLGYRLDAQVGPTITVGLGGVLTELRREFVLRIAPVSRAEATDMIEEVAGLAILRGYRGLPRGDVAALADAVHRLSGLALVESPRVLEAEVNPVLVRGEGQGVVALDGLLVVEGL
ncbi:MAG TPA: acetate--CoA ligase family protein [Azospirillum sp.]|nr:acetate--CoA ligase family protein [Azospirillum sp.]